jgi:hypothetical protein
MMPVFAPVYPALHQPPTGRPQEGIVILAGSPWLVFSSSTVHTCLPLLTRNTTGEALSAITRICLTQSCTVV